MARATPATQARVGFALKPTLTAATVDGDIIDVGARVWVHNGAGAPINVTVQTTTAVSGLDVADLVVPVPAGTDALIGPFSNLFKQAADAAVGAGKVLVDYSAIASVTRGAVTT